MMHAIALVVLTMPQYASPADLLDQLQSADVVRRRDAVVELGRVGCGAPGVVPALKAALQDGDVMVRIEAAEALSKLTGDFAVAMPVLAAALESGTSPQRDEAARVAISFGAHAGLLVHALRTALTDPSANARRTTIAAMRAAGRQAMVATAELERVSATDADPSVRDAAAWALMTIVPTRGVPLLARKVMSGDAGERLTAATALGEIGRDATPAVPALIGALTRPMGKGSQVGISIEEGDAQAKLAIIVALQRIGAKEAVGALQQLAANKREAAGIRRAAGHAAAAIESGRTGADADGVSKPCAARAH